MNPTEAKDAYPDSISSHPFPETTISLGISKLIVYLEFLVLLSMTPKFCADLRTLIISTRETAPATDRLKSLCSVLNNTEPLKLA